MLNVQLYGDDDLGWPGFVDDAIDWVVDKASDAGGAIQDGASWVVDKACATARDPKFMAATAGAAAIPTGVSQAAAGIAAGTSAACMILVPPGGPSIPAPPVKTFPLPTLVLERQMMFRPPAPPAPPALPAGTIAAFDAKRGGYRVAVPSGLAGFAAAASFTEVGTQASLPKGARLVDLVTFKKDTGNEPPWFKRPMVLGGIGLGVLVLAGGGYMALRR